MAVETLLAQTAREVVDAKEHNDTDHTLMEFGKCAVDLRNVLYQDRALNEVEFLFIENHFQVVQMAYLRWKRKHTKPTTQMMREFKKGDRIEATVNAQRHALAIRQARGTE
jgi:hypothetical protein